MSFKRVRDLVLGIFFLVLSIAIYVAAAHLPPSLLGGIGSDFMPRIIAVITGILSVLQILNGINELKKPEEESDAEEDKPEYIRVVLTIAAFTIYVFVLSSVGFLPSTIVYLFAQMIILAPKEKRNYLLFGVIAVVFSTVVYFLFRNALNVMLPTGIMNF